MEWVLSGKCKKYGDILTIFFGELIGLIFLYVVVEIEISVLVIAYIVVMSFLTLIFYATRSRWYPLVVRLDNDVFSMERLEPNGSLTEVINPVKLNTIHKVVIKKHVFYLFHVGDDGFRYVTTFGLAGMIDRLMPSYKEEIRKRQEILNEILKRIDRNRVEIVDKRKKKKI